MQSRSPLGVGLDSRLSLLNNIRCYVKKGGSHINVEMTFQRKKLIFESNPLDHDGSCKMHAWRTSLFSLTAKSLFLKINDAMLFCFIWPRLKFALSVVREENDGAARPLSCVNKQMLLAIRILQLLYYITSP